MRKYLDEKGVFYHISPYCNLASIKEKGLIPNNKGICVVRVNNKQIINAIINSQLGEINNGDTFIVVEITIPKNHFPIYAYEPDILDNTDWTWPLHNNIKVDNVPLQFITNITEDIYDLSQSSKDINNKGQVVNQEWFLESFDIVYETHYKMDKNSKVQNLGYNKLVKAYDIWTIAELDQL